MVFFFLLLFSLFKRFEDLMNNVPLPEYTRRDGSRNLVSRYSVVMYISPLQFHVNRYFAMGDHCCLFEVRKVYTRSELGCIYTSKVTSIS